MTALRWFVVNAAVFALLWLGFAEGNAGCRNLAYFWLWVQIIVALPLLSTEMAKAVFDKPRSVPAWLVQSVGTGQVAFLVWFGAIGTAIFYLLAIAIREAARQGVEKTREQA